jgi:hypothetical protein
MSEMGAQLVANANTQGRADEYRRGQIANTSCIPCRNLARQQWPHFTLRG